MGFCCWWIPDNQDIDVPTDWNFILSCLVYSSKQLQKNSLLNLFLSKNRRKKWFSHIFIKIIIVFQFHKNLNLFAIKFPKYSFPNLILIILIFLSLFHVVFVRKLLIIIVIVFFLKLVVFNYYICCYEN